jgi:type II secretory pathway component PulC
MYIWIFVYSAEILDDSIRNKIAKGNNYMFIYICIWIFIYSAEILDDSIRNKIAKGNNQFNFHIFKRISIWMCIWIYISVEMIDDSIRNKIAKGNNYMFIYICIYEYLYIVPKS